MIDKIFHVADVHIRNFFRHKEYNSVFEKLFKYIKENKTENSVIYLAGDIVHSKIEISPELVSETSKFLKNCADIAPTILITGNHDVNLSNDTRLDALTPIVEMLNHDNLHYWKDNGHYHLNGIDFSVYSIYNSPQEWLKADQIPGNFKIALHHGAVHSASTDMNYEIENDAVKTTVFDGFDLVLLGDIHKRQFLNSEQTIAYAGSLIQQNHGELLEHGIMVWDIPTKKCEIVDIPNDIAYVTVTVEDGKIINEPEYLQKFPKNLKLRIKHKNTDTTIIYDLISKFRKKFTILELNTIDLNDSYYTENSGFKLGDVRDVEYQNELIEEYILSLENSSLYNIDSIKHINRQVNSIYNSNQENFNEVRNTIWKPLYFEFSNMFSYGEDNTVDFTKFHGIEGLFAPNASGKSVLLDSLTFCIFDKCSRTYRSTDILNNNKDWFKCKLLFEINNKKFEIERYGKLNKKTEKVKVDVTFKQITENGEIILTDKDRDSTNKIIRQYLGSYDDFLLTTLSTQNDNKNFILKSQRERKDLLNSFLDISIFESLSKIVSEDLKIVNNDFYFLEKRIDDLNVHYVTSEIDSLTEKRTNFKKMIPSMKRNISRMEKNIDNLNSKKYNIHEVINIDDFNLKQSNVLKKQDILNRNIEEAIAHIFQLNEEQQILQDKLYNDFEIHDKNYYINNKEKLKNLKLEDLNINNVISTLQNEIQLHKDKIRLADNTKYNKNCEVCMSNPLIKEAELSRVEIPKILEKLKENEELSKTIKKEINTLNLNLQEYSNYKKELEDLNRTITNIQHKKLKFESDNRVLQQELEYINEKINLYNSQQEIQKNNLLIEKEIIEIKAELHKTQQELKSIEFRCIQLTEKINECKKKIKEYETLKLQHKEKLQELTDKKCYYEALNKYGIPYQLIKKVIPVIQADTNKILESIVNFQIEMECDEKNINCYLKYAEDKKWPVELGSGMEKFILSTVMRVALINISSLPRAEFLAIDEGFGVLDSENLVSVKLLFDYLKSKFKYLICITHLDSMKDLADNLIEISKDSNGFSKINV